MLSKGFLVFHYNDYSTIYLTTRIVAYLNSFQLLLNHIVVSVIVHISLCSSPIAVIKFVFIYIYICISALPCVPNAEWLCIILEICRKEYHPQVKCGIQEICP